MNSNMRARLAIDSRCIIGEGPTWDAGRGRLLWMDKASGTLFAAMDDGAGGWRERQRWELGRDCGAAVPRRSGGFAVVSGIEVLVLSETGEVAPFARVDADPKEVKINDAKCDPQGRLWAGTYAHDFSAGKGALYRIDPDGRVTTVLRDLGLSNGLAWSPDGATLYFIDSYTRSVEAFDFDGRLGTISRRRLVLETQGEGAPDGMTIDREGCLWVAVFGTAEVRRYSPRGELLASVAISADNVTSCCFGGADHGELFITSASIRLPEPLLPYVGISAETADRGATAPGAGGVFVCRPGAGGMPESEFAS